MTALSTRSVLQTLPKARLKQVAERALERFEEEVIDRLFALNAKRAEEERLPALAAGPKQNGRSRQARRAPKGATAQLDLGAVQGEEPEADA